MRVRVSCERDELVLMVVGPRWKNLDDLKTPCPEYPGLRPEYSGRVLQMRPCIVINASNVQRTPLLYFHKVRLHLLPCLFLLQAAKTRRRAQPSGSCTGGRRRPSCQFRGSVLVHSGRPRTHPPGERWWSPPLRRAGRSFMMNPRP